MSDDVRWIGPYRETDRFADSVTMDHVIELRKQVESLQKVVKEQHETIKTLENRCDDYRAALYKIVQGDWGFHCHCGEIASVALMRGVTL